MAAARIDVPAAAATADVVDRNADIGGVRFPLPRGWTVTAREDGDTVIACVAATPAIPCDGVTLTIAIPETAPLPHTVDAPVLGQHCVDDGGFVHVDGDIPLGQQGAAIAAGIDLKQWPHPTGPPLIQWTEATRPASSS